jgi:hypothetical protein
MGHRLTHQVYLVIAPGVIEIADDAGFKLGAVILPLVQARFYIPAWLIGLLALSITVANFFAPAEFKQDFHFLAAALRRRWQIYQYRWLWYPAPVG